MVATDESIQCHVEGGNHSGKTGAIRHELAWALQNSNPEYRPPLKRLVLLTRDHQKIEQKKIGLKKV
jgi:small subunit ribosomal protein S9